MTEASRRRTHLPAFVLFVAIFAVIAVDLAMDAHEGVGVFHMVVETLLMALSVVGAALLWRELRSAREEVRVLSRSVGAAQGEAERWRAEARELLEGLAVTIDRQFDRWELTAAEREVALLILKGLSHREAAAVRGTSERTVREQAQAVYRKGGLEGRSELAAFFLEDLLVPMEREPTLDEAAGG